MVDRRTTKRRESSDALGELVSRIAARDEQALRSLYDATSTCVLGIAWQVLRERAAAEETLVEVFAQVWRQADRYDPDKGSVLTWLATLTRTRAIDLRRARARTSRREVPIDSEAIDSLEEESQGPVEQSTAMERAARVQTALRALPIEQERAITATFVWGMSHSEAALALGQPLGTLKTRIRSGMAALRHALAPIAGDLQ